MEGKMNNKSFFIALIISLFFHLWVIQIYFIPFDKKQDQLKKEISVVSTRMTFFHSSSFSQPVEEIIDTSFPEDIEMADTILAKDMTIGQKKTLVENDKEEIVKNVKDSLPVIKERAEQHEAIEKGKIEKIIEEENIIQDKEDAVSPKKENIETIQPVAETEKEERESQNLPFIVESGIKEENKVIINKNETISVEGKGQIDPFQSSNSVKDQTRKNNLLKQEEIPLDLTQSDFSDSQVIPPKIVSFYPPDYPENLRKREIEGRVQLRVLIDKKGEAIQVEIENSSGYQALDQAALQSAYRWQFKPAQFGNKERDSWVVIPVLFQLE
jgi:TonB family protein